MCKIATLKTTKHRWEKFKKVMCKWSDPLCSHIRVNMLFFQFSSTDLGGQYNHIKNPNKGVFFFPFSRNVQIEFKMYMEMQKT